jgi:hypothetical protein
MNRALTLKQPLCYESYARIYLFVYWWSTKIGHAIAQEVRYLFLTAKPTVQFRINTCWYSWWMKWRLRNFCPSSDFASLIIIPHCFILNYNCPLKRAMALERERICISSGFNLKLYIYLGLIWLLSNGVCFIGLFLDTVSSWDHIEPNHRINSQ